MSPSGHAALDTDPGGFASQVEDKNAKAEAETEKSHLTSPCPLTTQVLLGLGQCSEAVTLLPILT